MGAVPAAGAPSQQRVVRALSTDERLGEQGLAEHLRLAGIEVDLVAPEQVVRRARACDVLVLPMSGEQAASSLALVPRVARHCRRPVLLAVDHGCEDVAAQALRDGASAFVLLPYDPGAVVERLHRLAAEQGEVPEPRLRAGAVVMDVRRREVRVHGAVVDLPAREFDILRLLLSRAGEVVGTQELLGRLWSGDVGAANSLAVHVRRLRARLERDPSRPELLCTVRGVGYKIAC